MNDRVMQFRVGVVVLATAIITGILIVLFGDLPSLVQATYPLKMSFTDARGVADEQARIEAHGFAHVLTAIERDGGGR